MQIYDTPAMNKRASLAHSWRRPSRLSLCTPVHQRGTTASETSVTEEQNKYIYSTTQWHTEK